MVETLITASPECFQGKKPREVKEFFEYALEFIQSKQSPETIISAVVHVDEKTPHMHHSGYDGFRRLLALDELQSVFKKLFYLPGLLTLEEHRAGSNQRLHLPDAVFPGTASMARRASFRAFHCVSSI